MLKLDPEDQRNLADGRPGVVEPVPGYWGKNGSTFVWFEQIEATDLADLMRMAWAQVAPKSLQARVSGLIHKGG